MTAKQTASGLICAFVSAAVAAPAVAADSGDTLEEIVVTARKRDESFRDVPMSVNVFTEEAISSAGIQRPADFIAKIPNMTLVETQNAGNAFVVVRGISKQAVGEIAANIRKQRPPEPYKGKGIRYEGEYVARKVGKRA